MYTVYLLNSGKRLLTDNSGEAPEESHISANVRKKIEIVSGHAYWDQEKLFDKTGGETSQDSVALIAIYMAVYSRLDCILENLPIFARVYSIAQESHLVYYVCTMVTCRHIVLSFL
jgi:hypothetical protein